MSNLQNVSVELQSNAETPPQNYSALLLHKLEQIALEKLDTAFGKTTLDDKMHDVSSVAAAAASAAAEELLDAAPSLIVAEHTHNSASAEMQLTRVVSDIWIGVILTLLIASVFFFLCSCFLYHKFQQWKNAYRAAHNENIEICRRYPADYEAESLPSYTIVSGLPTYDDALEEFRKAGLILKPPTAAIKIFDNEIKNPKIFSVTQALNDDANITANSVTNDISLCSSRICSDSVPTSANNSTTDTSNCNNNNDHNSRINNSVINLCLQNACTATQIIELSPQQLATLSQKRLSLQIAFNSGNSVRQQHNRSRIDLYRTANRNNHMRSRALSNAEQERLDWPPRIHRTSSAHSLAMERNRAPQQHRGSLC